MWRAELQLNFSKNLLLLRLLLPQVLEVFFYTLNYGGFCFQFVKHNELVYNFKIQSYLFLIAGVMISYLSIIF